MKQLFIWMLTLIIGGSCFAEDAVRQKSKTENEWSGKSFRDVTYKQVGKRKLGMDIYLPTDRKFAPSPVIYYVHGGGWAAGSKRNFAKPLMLPVFRQLADSGFVCVSVDYRLCRKGTGVQMRDCVTDAMDGLRFLNKHHQQYVIDPDRIVVFGDSAGGQLAQMLTCASPAKFPGDQELVSFDVQPLAGISWYGPSDFTDVNLFKTDLSDKNPDRFGARIVGTNGSDAKNPQAFEEMSPYFWIKKDSPPMLVLQGDTDATIPLPHAIHLKEKADRIGADVEMLVVKNAGHNWRKAGGDPVPGVEEIQRMTADYAMQQVANSKR
ncbi:Acetyl esterase/lipase [Neorhodopirellula lusitana]|uniref:Acetyl esterase/lipase n=1 Tax=Neorhodopirellula lusitana TaxID=445327 RepID=A0ABY1Q0S8_9BACT|nr:alpha/beta hydrolase [Neorhodopirellula lusitana]SMP55641.1 Acetyl esterase/lipase [Neorhodopirellula lusitana]